MSAFLQNAEFIAAIRQIAALGASPGGPPVDGRTLAGLLASAFSTIPAGDGILNNLAATTDPAATDDTNAGYQVGSHWINITRKRAFVCTKANAGAAEWDLVSPRQEIVLLVKGGFGSTDTETYPTITAATAAASSGDLILIGAGAYLERVNLPTAVSLVGAGTQNGGSFIADFLPGATPILTANGGQKIEGVTLSWAGGPTGGASDVLLINDPRSVELKDVVITYGTTNGRGLGLAAGLASASVIMEECKCVGSLGITGATALKFDKAGDLQIHNTSFSVLATDIAMDLSGGPTVRGARITCDTGNPAGAGSTFMRCADADVYMDDLTVLNIATAFNLINASANVNVSSTYLPTSVTSHLTASVAGSFFQALGGQVDLSKVTHDPAAKVLIAGGNIQAGKEGYTVYGSTGLTGNPFEIIVAGTPVLTVDPAGKLSYSPLTPANWAGAAPTALQDAVDRIAAVVAGAHGPIA